MRIHKTFYNIYKQCFQNSSWRLHVLRKLEWSVWQPCLFGGGISCLETGENISSIWGKKSWTWCLFIIIKESSLCMLPSHALGLLTCFSLCWLNNFFFNKKSLQSFHFRCLRSCKVIWNSVRHLKNKGWMWKPMAENIWFLKIQDDKNC